MDTNTMNDALHNASLDAKVSDEEWLALHIPRFKESRQNYLDYERFLERVLKEVCKRLAPLAIVNARAKSLPSFAEKILRKKRLYTDPKDPLPPDPLIRMTDLCGGRVIVHTAQEVERVCEFIKNAFEIDWANSEDTSQRLKPTEFGYRSVHYIVIADSERLQKSGVFVPVPISIKGLKAEIQVRTLLEHASADIGHDTLYKAAMRVPAPVKRRFAALAAVLESADREFERLFSSLNDFKSNFGAWHKPDEVNGEITRLLLVLKCDPDNEELAVRIGQLALAIGEHQAALEVLKPFLVNARQGVQRVCGLARTELNWNNPQSNDFAEGVKLLEAACNHAQADSETLCALAECLAHRHDDERAWNFFQKAIVVDPSEPLSFCRFLEFEIAHQRNDAMVRLTEPTIQKVMERCRREIEAGVNLPNAWSCLTIFQLLLGDTYGALSSLAQLLTLCGRPAGATITASSQPCAAGRSLRRMRDTLRHLDCLRAKIPGFDWVERLLLLALAVLVQESQAWDEVRNLVSWQKSKGQPIVKSEDSVLILSGGCEPAVQPFVDNLAPELLRGLGGNEFTLLSGGTTMGMSGLAGELGAQSGGKIRALGYLPAQLPVGVHEDAKRFAALVQSSGVGFTPLDPLQGWTDLLAAGVDPRRVKLLAYAPGKVSRAECAIALAFGARVGLIENSVLPKDRQCLDSTWRDHPHLTRLPMDAMTFRAFLFLDDLPLSDEEKQRLENAARMAHQDYVASATPRDPSLSKWNDLDQALKDSNYSQVAYWEKMLREHGLSVRSLTDEDKTHDPLKMEDVVGDKVIQKLAEMEHGRWNVERLTRGWQWAETKDLARKRNPCLVPWPALTNINGTDYQPYDIEAVSGLPRKLREVGLELCRL